MDDLNLYDILLRISVAALCGSILGWEREASDKPAGLRTNMLVAIGAATATLSALDLYVAVAEHSNASMPADPVRIISGVIGGLGFLGAGYFQSKGNVRGMTTAATLWVVGGIGVACGLGNFEVALSSVGVTFVVLFAIGKFKRIEAAPQSMRPNNFESDNATTD